MRKFVTGLSAAAILLAVGTTSPIRSAAAGPGIGDGPPVSAKPRPGVPGIRTIQVGETVTLKKGERVRVMLPQAPAIVGQKQGESDEGKLIAWLKDREGLTFAQVQAYIAAERLTIPRDVLTGIENALGGTGNKPGPASNPGIMTKRLISSRWETLWMPNDDYGEAGENMGIVGAVTNSGNHVNDFPLSVNETIASSASVLTGINAQIVSAQVGFSVTYTRAVTVSIVVKDVLPGERVQVRGWNIGDLVRYEYDRSKFGLYYDTATRRFTTELMEMHTYHGWAFNSRYMELESLESD